MIEAACWNSSHSFLAYLVQRMTIADTAANPDYHGSLCPLMIKTSANAAGSTDLNA